MIQKNTGFRGVAFLRHWCAAWNTGGEGIHSPYLFYMVRMLFYDRHAYYCFSSIEQERCALLSSARTITVRDFGTGASLLGDTYTQSVRAIAKSSLEQPKIAQLLFRLVVFLGHEAARPLEVVELGTSLGITTAYLASADSRNRITTFEGSPAIAEVARQVWQRLGLTNIRLVEGNLNDTLDNTLNDTFNNTRNNTGTHTPDDIVADPLDPTLNDTLNTSSSTPQKTGAVPKKQIDLAYIDANHTECATWRYFTTLLPMAGTKSIFVIDDIHYSPQMEAAWRRICAHEAVTTTMDLWSVGIVFFDPHYLRKHYRMRV